MTYRAAKGEGMSCRSAFRTIVALGLVWAVQSAWLPVSEAGDREERPRVARQEGGGLFASVWSSLARLWDKNGCAIDPNGCAPFPITPDKDPARPPGNGAQGSPPPHSNG